MSVSTRVGILILAGAVILAAREWDLTTRAPHEATAAAVAQLENSDTAAERLRLADAAKNWWLLAAPLVIAVLAGLLFEPEIRAWLHPETSSERRRV